MYIIYLSILTGWYIQCKTHSHTHKQKSNPLTPLFMCPYKGNTHTQISTLYVSESQWMKPLLKKSKITYLCHIITVGNLGQLSAVGMVTLNEYFFIFILFIYIHFYSCIRKNILLNHYWWTFTAHFIIHIPPQKIYYHFCLT